MVGMGTRLAGRGGYPGFGSLAPLPPRIYIPHHPKCIDPPGLKISEEKGGTRNENGSAIHLCNRRLAAACLENSEDLARPVPDGWADFHGKLAEGPNAAVC